MWMFAFAIVLLLLTAVAISLPLLRPQLEPYAQDALPGEAFNEREALLEAMSDLTESHHAGKISEADFAVQHERLQQHYVQVMDREAGTE